MKKINYLDSIKSPIITEKATTLSEQNKIVFKVHLNASKHSIKKNIAFGLSTKDINNGRLEEVLEMCNLKKYRNKFPQDISGGQQQRVLLARALMQGSDVLLLDEPCSAIDPPTRTHLLQVMRQQADSGQTLLVSSHDWGKALDSYDRVLAIDRRLIVHGTPSEVRETISDMDGMMGGCCG